MFAIGWYRESALPRAWIAGLLTLAACACAPSGPAGPDMILTGGTIYPLGTTEHQVEALAVRGESISAIGTDAEIRALAGDDTQEMELDGAVVLPGFYDAWIDLEAIGRWSAGLDLRRAGTPREVQAKLRAALALDARGWAIGWGWDESIWPRPELPTHEVLDAVETERPVVLFHHSGRLAWLNSAAMAASELETAVGLVRDDRGDWTGLVHGAALRALAAGMPPPDRELRRQWMGAGLHAAAAAGITTAATAPLDAGALTVLADLHADGDLSLRLQVRVATPASGIDAFDLGSGSAISALGLQLDGPVTPGLAALTAPYDAGPALAGAADVEAAARAACDAAAAAGLRADFQAHGDRAILAAARCAGMTAGDGLLIGVDLLPQEGIGATRVAAVPLRMTHDLYVIDARLGAQRQERSHAFRTLVANGNLVAFASMAPYYPLTPMGAVRAAWQRQDDDGYPLDGWTPGQRISVADGIRLAIGRLGEAPRTLGPGTAADLVVWSHDPYTTSETSLRHTRAMLTVVGGRVVYSRPLVELPFERD